MNRRFYRRALAPVICTVGLLAASVGTAAASPWSYNVPINPGTPAAHFTVAIPNLYAANNYGTVSANAITDNGAYWRFSVYCAYTDGSGGYWNGWVGYINTPAGTGSGLINSNSCASGRTVLSFYINLAYPFGHLCWDLASNTWGWNKDSLCA
jgi:hypothetical protein